MQWLEDNSKDTEMLRRIDLSPLDTVPAEDNEELAERVQRHNGAPTELAERFGQLARDREAVAKADHWFDSDSKAVLAEHRRVLAESWDSLVTLRTLLRDRQEVLRELEGNVSGNVGALQERYDQAFDSARKAMARRHRRYLKAEPVRGRAYVDSLAGEDEAVVELHQQIAQLRRRLSALKANHYCMGQGAALTSRQLEVYEQLS